MSKKLFLFDIDGTLLKAGDLSVGAYADAFDAVLGTPYNIREVECAGRTDPYIVKSLLKKKQHSPEACEDLLPPIFSHFLANIEKRVDDGATVTVLPGVVETLEYLSAHENGFLALLTGNLEQGATQKLRAAGLDHYFEVGAFGSDHEERNLLGPVALQRASEHFGHTFATQDVFVVGDSIYDIHCARAADFPSVVLPTGNHSLTSLAAEQPTFLLEEMDPSFFDELL